MSHTRGAAYPGQPVRSWHGVLLLLACVRAWPDAKADHFSIPIANANSHRNARSQEFVLERARNQRR